jgi:hypothetical protein
MTENPNAESAVAQPLKPRSRLRNCLWFKASAPRQSKPVKPRKVRPAPEKIEREWNYRETREPGFPFSAPRQPRHRALRFVRGVSYWIHTLLALAFVLVLLAVIVWAVGELRIYGYGPADVWTARAAHFAIWVNVHLGGKSK